MSNTPTKTATIVGPVNPLGRNPTRSGAAHDNVGLRYANPTYATRPTQPGYKEYPG